MNRERFTSITGRYAGLRIAVLGDFCLDRYLEIDPTKTETSIETGLPVYNVVRVRAQAGGAGTILNNLAALGIGRIYPVGFVGEDGEGFELTRALLSQAGVRPQGIVRTEQRCTFTYCKPLLVGKGKVPEELNRFDSKNWSTTPRQVEDEIIGHLSALRDQVDAIIVLDQVDLPDTGVVTRRVLEAVGKLSAAQPELLVLADSRRGLKDFPPVVFKMNATELCRLSGSQTGFALPEIKNAAQALAQKNQRLVFVTLAEQGIVGTSPQGAVEHLLSLPRRGPIDVVGAGDAVSANLTSAVAAGASLREAVEIANGAASVVIHKLGTTGTATLEEIRALLDLA